VCIIWTIKCLISLMHGVTMKIKKEVVGGIYRVLVGEPEARRPLGRTRRRWGDTIKMDLTEIGWDSVDSNSTC
jgi:hypothetical protein